MSSDVTDCLQVGSAPPPDQCNVLATKLSPAASYLPVQVPSSARQDRQAQGHHCGLAEYATKEAELPQVELAQLVMEGLQQGRKSRLRVVWVP